MNRLLVIRDLFLRQIEYELVVENFDRSKNPVSEILLRRRGLYYSDGLYVYAECAVSSDASNGKELQAHSMCRPLSSTPLFDVLIPIKNSGR